MALHKFQRRQVARVIYSFHNQPGVRTTSTHRHNTPTARPPPVCAWAMAAPSAPRALFSAVAHFISSVTDPASSQQQQERAARRHTVRLRQQGSDEHKQPSHIHTAHLQQLGQLVTAAATDTTHLRLRVSRAKATTSYTHNYDNDTPAGA